MLRAMVVLRADPWNPDYGMGYEAQAEEPGLRADPSVETSDWSAPRSPAAPRPEPVWFVDGVRRVELRVVAEDGDARGFGLFGSYAVGSVRCDGKAAFGQHHVCHAVVVGSGIVHDPVEVAVGGTRLCFDPAAAPGGDINAPLQKLQGLMREAENNLGARLISGGAPLVIADGPLRLGEEVSSPVVGVIKRFVRRYLDSDHDALLPRLEPGQRTPVFALLDPADGGVRGFSWYTRLTVLRPPWHDHAGLVRCEVRAAVGEAGAVGLADRVSAVLPRFAGRASDPRAPQNLAPVGGLETWLRHRMGDARLVRRALLTHLAAPAGVGS
jgi:hypothetical protein